MDNNHKSRKELIREIEELKKKLPDFKTNRESKPIYGSSAPDILNRNEVLFAETQKLSHTGSWYLDLITKTISWSDEVYRIFGAGQSDFNSTFESFLEFVHPDDRLFVSEAYRDSLAENGDTSELVHRVIQRNSRKIVYVLEKSISVRSDEGTVEALIGIVQDITEIKKNQDELTEKNRILNVLLNNLNGVAYRCINDQSWTMKFLSDGVFELTGYRPDDFIDNRLIEYNSLIFEEDRQKVWDEIQESIKEKRRFTLEYRIVTSTGQIKWVWERGRGIFGGRELLALEGFISDNTETKLAQIRLQESEMHFRHLADTGQALIWTSGLDKKCNYFNKVWLDFTGRSVEQELGDGWLEGVHPDDLEKCIQIYVSSFDRHEKFQMDYRLRHNQGTYRWIHDSGVPRFDNEGNFMGYIGHCLDINDMILQKEELANKEKDYRILFENNPEAMFIVNLNNFRILEANSAALKLYGYEKEEFLTLTLIDIRPKEDIQILHEKHLASRATIGNLGELRHKRKNGEVFWVEIQYHDLIYNGNNARHVSVSDISARKLTEILLRESEEKHRVLSVAIRQSPVSISITDLQGNIKYVNPAFCNCTGYSEEEIIGKNMRVFKSGNTAPEVYDDLWKTINSGKDWHSDFLNKKKSGVLYWEEVSISPIFEEDGKVVNFLAVKQDITSRKISEDQIIELNLHLEEKIRERTAELENFFSLALDMLCISDLAGNFIKLNRSWENILGYPLAELEHKKFLDFVHPDDMQATLDAMNTLGSQEPVINFTNRYSTKDAGYRYIEWRSVPIGNLVYSAARDITNRIESENEIKNAKAEAERANNAKSQFLANMSHEIRTPMNAILGYSELLGSMVNDKTQIEFLRSIRTSGKTLLSLINDILDLSKIEAGKLELEFDYINSSSFFPEFERIFSFKIREKGLRFVSEISEDIPTYLYVDGLRLRQIILNLIGNSVKFTEKGEIRFSVHTGNTRTSSESNNMEESIVDLFINISDTGVGIPEEFQDKIFGSFFQIKGKQSQSGTGLGLSITRRLVEMMNGEINLVSKPGAGSTFSVILPGIRSVENYENDQIGGELIPSGIIFSKGHILIVDDIEENRKIIKDTLRETPLTILEADDGETALEILDKIIPDLVITDIRMPKLDGFGLLKKIKSTDRLHHIPVIAYSASVMKEEQELISKSEFAGLLIKPFQLSNLYRELIRFLPHTIIDKSFHRPADDFCLEQSDIVDFPEMMKLLEGKLYEEWKSYENRQPLGKIKNFGIEISELGAMHNCKQVIQYGDKLLFAADSFNIEEILTLLGKFPELINCLKKN